MNKEQALLEDKILRYAKSKIKELNLSLKNKVILTECSSSYYKYLPIIASLSGAKKVYSFSRDNSYGKAENFAKEGESIARRHNLKNISFSTKMFNPSQLSSVDIITNSGALRPLNSKFLQFFKEGTCISLMYEKWEFRDGEIDLEFCKKNSIKVGGIFENHPKLKVFERVGHLILKMIFEANLEIYSQNFFVYSNDDFGRQIYKSLKSNNAGTVTVSDNFRNLYTKDITYDVIILSSYHENKSFNSPSFFNISKIKKTNPNVEIVHLFGKVDYKKIRDQGVEIHPDKNGLNQIMSRNLAYLGYKVFIDLMIGGLKVGQLLHEKKAHNKILQKMI